MPDYATRLKRREKEFDEIVLSNVLSDMGPEYLLFMKEAVPPLGSFYLIK